MGIYYAHLDIRAHVSIFLEAMVGIHGRTEPQVQGKLIYVLNPMAPILHPVPSCAYTLCSVE